MSFRCDWNGECNKRPFMEVFTPSTEDESGKWCYLCFWHYLYARIRGDKVGYCRIDTDRQMIELLMEEIWDIQSDLIEIKEKLGIKKETPEIEFMTDKDEGEIKDE